MIKLFRKLPLLTFILFLGGIFASPASAVFDMGLPSLQGLKGVQLIVRKLPPGIENADSLKENMQKSIREKLTKADIKILDARETLFSPGAPSLDIDVKMFPLEGSFEKAADYFYVIDVSLTQGVFLGRDSEINLHADTWTARDYGQTSTLAKIKTKTDLLIDKFISAYKTANAETKPSTISPKIEEKTEDFAPLEEK